MAIFVEGMSCRLCGKPMSSRDRKVMFAPFVANEADPLLKFSDATFHEECFRRDPMAREVELRVLELEKRGLPKDQSCVQCGEKIIDPEDYFTLGFLTDDCEDPMFRFNFYIFHRSCLSSWPDLMNVSKYASAAMQTGMWKGEGMQWLADTLEEAMP